MKYFLSVEDDSKVEVFLGQDVDELLGIEKFSPVIPTNMAGEVCNIGSHNTIRYDIENSKKYPNVFQEGEDVFVTEKIHGTFCGIGYIPGLNHPDLFDNGDLFVFSKGLGAQGLVFKNNEKNKDNIYVQQLKKFQDSEEYQKLKKAIFEAADQINGVFFLGEIFGPVQDLKYGLTSPDFRLFDFAFKGKEGPWWAPPARIKELCKSYNFKPVDVLYQGPYSKQKMDELAAGMTITGNGTNILEGIVIKPAENRRDDEIGRVILKHISEAYLLRKDTNATEFN